jgi:hypothetical protein
MSRMSLARDGGLACAVALSFACGNSPGSRADAGTLGADAADGASPGAALAVDFRAAPALPADLGGPSALSLNRLALYALRDVQVVGEASSGDGRTTLSSVTLDWRDPESGDAWVSERTVEFRDAPVGTYSNLVFRLESYEFRGELDVSGNAEFAVEDELDAKTVVVDLADAVVAPGRTTTVVVGIDVATPLLAVDWSAVAQDDDSVELESSDPQISLVRAAVLKSFAAYAP